MERDKEINDNQHYYDNYTLVIAATDIIIVKHYHQQPNPLHINDNNNADKEAKR